MSIAEWNIKGIGSGVLTKKLVDFGWGHLVMSGKIYGREEIFLYSFDPIKARADIIISKEARKQKKRVSRSMSDRFYNSKTVVLRIRLENSLYLSVFFKVCIDSKEWPNRL